MTVTEQYAHVQHKTSNCPVCPDEQKVERYLSNTRDWRTRLALIRLRDVLRAWCG